MESDRPSAEININLSEAKPSKIPDNWVTRIIAGGLAIGAIAKLLAEILKK